MITCKHCSREFESPGHLYSHMCPTQTCPQCGKTLTKARPPVALGFEWMCLTSNCPQAYVASTPKVEVGTLPPGSTYIGTLGDESTVEYQGPGGTTVTAGAVPNYREYKDSFCISSGTMVTPVSIAKREEQEPLHPVERPSVWLQEER